MSRRRPLFNILYLTVCLSGWTTGQTIYNAFNYYKPMTGDYDVRHRGQVFIPPCIKSLMNCWEVIKPDLVCKYGIFYRIAMESMCMDLRFQCREYTGPQPFRTLNVSTWNFCPTNIESQKAINLHPIHELSRNDVMGVNNFGNDN